jgi:hypothetical protein
MRAGGVEPAFADLLLPPMLPGAPSCIAGRTALRGLRRSARAFLKA